MSSNNHHTIDERQNRTENGKYDPNSRQNWKSKKNQKKSRNHNQQNGNKTWNPADQFEPFDSEIGTPQLRQHNILISARDHHIDLSQPVAQISNNPGIIEKKTSKVGYLKKLK